MPGAFFDSFNASLQDMEGQFTENWSINGAEYPAIAIETLREDHHVIKGGTLLDVTCRVIMRDEVFEASGVKIGDFVSIRGVDAFAVAHIVMDGDASKTIECVARGIDYWR